MGHHSIVGKYAGEGELCVAGLSSLGDAVHEKIRRKPNSGAAPQHPRQNFSVLWMAGYDLLTLALVPKKKNYISLSI
jgi:hypothetical protein